MKKIIAFILVIALSFSSCEKDDICDANTPTTPRLVITFHDISNASVLKNVTNLKVIGEGMTQGIVFNPSSSGEDKYRTNGSSISIPLKTNLDVTSFTFILNSGNTNTALVNSDNLKFNYTRKDEFVSRACGFKTLFILNQTKSVVHTDAVPTDGLWIKYFSIERNNINNENETHVKIFF